MSDAPKLKPYIVGLSFEQTGPFRIATIFAPTRHDATEPTPST